MPVPKPVSSMFHWSKKAVITGATGSIGFAIARRFAQEGASVVLAGRNKTKLEQQYNAIALNADTKSEQIHSMHCFDVRNASGWEGLVTEHVSCPHFIHLSHLSTTSKHQCPPT